MSKDETTQPILDIFDNFDKVAETLNKIPKSAKEKTNKLLNLFFNEKNDIFEQPKGPQEFLQALHDLSEEIGHAYHTVLAIELARQRITPYKVNEVLDLLPRQSGNPNQPIVLQPNAPQLGVLSGVWYYKAAKEIAKATMKNEAATTPQIATNKEVVDILEFGRQLIPEFVNKTIMFFRSSIDHLYFFDDKETRERFRSELLTHLSKLSSIIRTFSRTITEYRKDLLSQGKQDMAKAVIALKMAEANIATRPGAPISIDPMSLQLKKSITE